MHTREDSERLGGFGWHCAERGSAENKLLVGDQIELAGRLLCDPFLLQGHSRDWVGIRVNSY